MGFNSAFKGLMVPTNLVDGILNFG